MHKHTMAPPSQCIKYWWQLVLYAQCCGALPTDMHAEHQCAGLCCSRDGLFKTRLH